MTHLHADGMSYLPQNTIFTYRLSNGYIYIQRIQTYGGGSVNMNNVILCIMCKIMWLDKQKSYIYTCYQPFATKESEIDLAIVICRHSCICINVYIWRSICLDWFRFKLNSENRLGSSRPCYILHSWSLILCLVWCVAVSSYSVLLNLLSGCFYFISSLPRTAS